MKEEHNIKRISKQKKEFISSLCENVISAKSKNEWEEAVAACIAEPNKMADLTALPGVSEIAVAHDLGFYPAALLYHSKNTDGNK